jgi:CPA2 family monovalent cation:H+ antiporter-2
MLATVLLCFGTSWASAQLGLSAPLGAFFAGLMLANTEYHYQISGEVTPFRHIFISIFFVSIGLLFDPLFSLANWQTVIPVSGLVLFVNVAVTAVVILALGYSPRVAVTTGILLSQIGEFSFLLLENAKSGKLIDDIFYQTILSSAVLTILLTPFLFNAVPWVMKLFSKIPAFGMPPQPKDKSGSTRRFKDHIILCGYGTAGQDLAGALMLEKIPFLVIEMSPLNIQKARSHNVAVLFGDAMNESVLHEAAIEKAKAVVISFGDASGIAVIIRLIQGLNPKVLTVVRCRYERDVAWLYELGADVVVMEELELSAELTRVILEHSGLPEPIVHTHISRIRARKEFLIEQNILKKLK